MDQKDLRYSFYLAKVKEAEDMANKVEDPIHREIWQRISDGYRGLLKLVSPRKQAGV